MLSIFAITNDALYAQNKRLEATASNMAHVDHVYADAKEVYREKIPIFTENLKQSYIEESTQEPLALYKPEHPQANEEGYIFSPNINRIDQFMHMMSASRSYQNSVDMLNTAQKLILNTISILE